MSELIEAFRDLLEAHCTSAVVRAIEAERSSGLQRDMLMSLLTNSGFADAMVRSRACWKSQLLPIATSRFAV